MGTALVLVGVVALIAFNLWLHDPQAGKQKRQAALERQARIVCPHCHKAGDVTVVDVRRKKGISGGKATGAFFTAGASMLLTGLSRKEAARELTCSNCGMTTTVS